MKEKDENNFYNFVKNMQGFIEKIMIFYKNLQDKNITIGKYIELHGFRNPPELMTELPIKALPIEWRVLSSIRSSPYCMQTTEWSCCRKFRKIDLRISSQG
jgi:hypothetical protein